jgi:hypothetical protein
MSRLIGEPVKPARRYYRSKAYPAGLRPAMIFGNHLGAEPIF